MTTQFNVSALRRNPTTSKEALDVISVLLAERKTAIRALVNIVGRLNELEDLAEDHKALRIIHDCQEMYVAWEGGLGA